MRIACDLCRKYRKQFSAAVSFSKHFCKSLNCSHKILQHTAKCLRITSILLNQNFITWKVICQNQLQPYRSRISLRFFYNIIEIKSSFFQFLLFFFFFYYQWLFKICFQQLFSRNSCKTAVLKPFFKHLRRNCHSPAFCIILLKKATELSLLLLIQSSQRYLTAQISQSGIFLSPF